MPTIAVSECKQEVSTFNPVPSRYEDFRTARGQAVLDYHRNVKEEVGGHEIEERLQQRCVGRAVDWRRHDEDIRAFNERQRLLDAPVRDPPE